MDRQDKEFFSPALSRIPGIRHGFGTAAQPVPPALVPAWDHRPNKRQVHGTRAMHIVEPSQVAGEADAFLTTHAGIPVSVITADCVPVLLARCDGGAVAAVHAGWRGLFDGIIPSVLRELEAGADWVAAVGPTICTGCYEVSPDLAISFGERFPAVASTIVPRTRHLDLRALAEYQLRAGGVTSIDHVGGCTCCTRDAAGRHVFLSYRRGDRNANQHAGLIIEPPSTPTL
jgi:YfiH family protein